MRVSALLVGLVLALQALLVGPIAASDPSPPPPSSMASTGDSITRAFNTCSFPFIDCVVNSWSTGTDSTVNSHYRRILANNRAINGRNYNDARSGAKMADLPRQMGVVAGRNVGYVTVLVGANDVCTSSESTMTDPAVFHGQFAAALSEITTRSPGTLIYVISIPDLHHLWSILKDNSSARSAWRLYGTCQALLANPQSTAQADVDRRNRVRLRNIDLNEQLRAGCQATPNCRFDMNAGFALKFAARDVSTRDYFHPSKTGQATTASASWLYGYWGGAPLNVVWPTASFGHSCSNLTCTFTDTSHDGGAATSARIWLFPEVAGGLTSTSASASVTFPAAGTYTVRLTAIDGAGGTGTLTTTITVGG